jgi:hypothetical protein
VTGRRGNAIAHTLAGVRNLGVVAGPREYAPGAEQLRAGGIAEADAETLREVEGSMVDESTQQHTPSGLELKGRRIRPPLLVGTVILVVIGLVDLLLRHESALSGDEPFYDRMAAHPSGPHNFPYAYRIGVPWIVHALPFSRTVGFTVLALLGIAASAAALYALLEEFRIGPKLGWALCLGFALSPTFLIVLVRHGRSIDPASVLVMVLGCLFIVQRRRFALCVTILLGVTIRESSIFLIPLAYAVWTPRLIDLKTLREVAIVGVLPVAAYVALRLGIDAVGRQYIPGYTGSFLHERVDIVREGLSNGSAGVELRRLAYTYGPLWLVAPWALRDLRFARRGLVLVALCVGSLTFAFDWGRIMFLAAPVVYVAAAHVLTDRRRLALATVALLLVVDVGYGVYLDAYGTEHGLDTSVSKRVPVY